MSSSISCTLSDKCSGCDRIDLDLTSLALDRQAELARLNLDQLSVETVWIRSGGLRDRLEFTLSPRQNGTLAFGLFEKFSTPKARPEGQLEARPDIVDIDLCPQLSPALQLWLNEFRRDLPPVPAPRSVRLRVSPSGVRGAWLDFSNEDIRDLLNDGAWLTRQLEREIIVEVGQKRKRIVPNPEGPRSHRLIDPVLDPWFETLAFDGSTLKPVPLYSAIGTFTQPGFEANRALVRTVLDHIGPHSSLQNTRIAEFGAGIGNFTLPLISSGASVDVFESDRLALTALEKGVEAAGLDRSKLKVYAGDFIQSGRAAEQAFASSDVTARRYDVVLVDPPRPGLGRFIDAIHAQAACANWVYVSCYPESFAKDVAALQTRGLELSRLTVVEQFPFTRHFEIVASFTTREFQKSKR